MEGMEMIMKVEMISRRKKKTMVTLVSQKFKYYRPNTKLQKNGEEKSWWRGAQQKYRRSKR